MLNCQENQLSALEWKKLYLQLEGKMRRFRIRAVDIRSKLAIKMAELEFKVDQAEEKAATAEYQLEELRNNIAPSADVAAQDADFLKKRLLDLDKRCVEQSERIVVLEKQLENETYIRNIEQQALQNKALKIKDWVLGVLRKAEKEKRELQTANDRLNTAVKLMQQRLADVVGSSSEFKSHTYNNEGHVTTEETSSSPLRSHQLDSENKMYSEISSSKKDNSVSLFPMFPMELDFCNTPLDDAEQLTLTEEKKNVYETIADFPTIKPESVKPLSPKQSTLDSFPPSSAGSEMHPKSKKDLGVKDDHKASTLPFPTSSFSASKSDSENSNPGHTYYNIMGTFDSIRRKFKGLTDSHQKSKPLGEASASTTGRGRDKRLKPKRTDRSRSASKTKKSPTSSMSIRKLSVTSQKKEESFQKDDPMMVEQLSSSLPASHLAWKSPHRLPPPTPPLHRQTSITSAETRIYEIAEAAGFKISTAFVSKSYKVASCQTKCEVGKYEELVYQKHPFGVPVFARVEGNSVDQLRPTPFNDTSDSSEEDVSPFPVFPGRRLSPRHLQRVKSTSNDSLAQQQRKNGSPGIPRAIKRGNSQQSIASSESDYAIPPDAQGSTPSPPTDSLEPEHKLIKTSKHSSIPTGSRMPSSQSKRVEMEASTPGALKCGYLNKLSGRSRTWSKRWFVLRNQSLFCYRSPNDVMKKAQREIILNRQSTKIERDNSNSSTIRITAGRRVYYLSAETSKSTTDWMLCLQAAGATSICGWVNRTFGGSDCRSWAILKDSEIKFYEKERDQIPFDSLCLSGCKIEEAQLNLHLPISPGHAQSPPLHTYDHVLIVRSQDRGRDTYLSFETAKQKMTWLQVMMSSITTSLKSQDVGKSATEFEKLVLKVLQSRNRTRGDAGGDTVWLHPVLSNSKQGITRPLTSLSSDALKTEAMKIAKSIQLFTNETLGSETVDYHVTLAHCIAQSCLTHPELRNEVYSQLIKETNRKKQEKSGGTDSTHLQAWKLLSLLIPIFLPQNDWKQFLRKHLSRNEDKKSTIGQYVIYCLRSLERATTMGDRCAPPSRTESISVLLQKPYQHSLPLSVPVHFADGSYEVVSFDCSTTVNEFSKRVTKQSGLHDHHKTGFALHVDNPDQSKSLDHHLLDPSAKICDVISLWETVVRHDVAICKTLGFSQEGTGEAAKSPKFVFKRYLFSEFLMKRDNTKEKYLLLHQIATNMSRDLLPVSRDLALEMTSLLLQFSYGDRPSSTTSSVDQTICKYFPGRYQGKNFLRQIRERVLSRWEALEGMQTSDCVRIFLTVARKWPHLYTKLYQAQIARSKMEKSESVWFSVGARSFSILQRDSMDLMEIYDYSQIVTFGGSKDQLLIVVSTSGLSRKLLFDMNKIEMLELVNTVAEYMKIPASNTTLEKLI